MSGLDERDHQPVANVVRHGDHFITTDSGMGDVCLVFRLKCDNSDMKEYVKARDLMKKLINNYPRDKKIDDKEDKTQIS